MFKEKTEDEKFVTHKDRDDFIKKVEKALTNPELTEEDYEELRQLFND